MKKTKIISLLLSVSMLVSVAIPGTLAQPEENPGTEGLEISKTATENKDGTYTIQLEAYATGDKIITEAKADVPTDIVLVLDQSGSMEEDMSTYSFSAYENRDNSYLYGQRHNRQRNKNLYYKLEDGSYVEVYVTRTEGEGNITYTQCPADWPNDSYFSSQDNYFTHSSNLYVKSGDSWQKVTLERKESGSFWERKYQYIYTFPDGSTVVSENRDGLPGFGEKGPLYYVTQGRGDYEYTYTYRVNGRDVTIGTSTGQDTVPEFTLYERSEGGSVSRLSALRTAVTNFADSVAEKAKGKDGQLGTDDDVNHRIAVVGFASKSGYGNNTELLSISGSNSGNVGVKYGSISQQNYKDVLQSMTTQAGRNMVNSAINALATEGATEANLGMEMANGILDANPVPTGEKRNRVVILFTDGSPTTFNGFSENVANSAIAEADTARAKGANVYSVGIFEGADASSAGSLSGDDTQKANWFMQNVSDNKGTPQNPSYYLSAADADSLNDIFQQISDNIETGGSSTTLDENAIIKDIIAPSFQLPKGATVNDIKLETYSYTGENQWQANNDTMGATATVEDDKVDVTGFDFAENWCGKETTNGMENYRGNKLVISFKVEPKPGFLGGNGVYTNTNAGVYENGQASDPLFTFNRPQVDVEIKEINVTAQDKNIYLMGDLTAEQIKSGAIANVGDVELKLGETNYGLQDWQHEYVEISVDYQDKNGNTLNNLENLIADTTYSVVVTVKPKETKGTAVEQTDSDDGNINVFKPELTFKDGEAWYGGDVPADTELNTNLTKTEWKHGETVADTTKMGDAPELTLTYTLDASKLKNGKINSKTADIPVDVTIKFGEGEVTDHTAFQHTNCDGKTCKLPENNEFLLHINTCRLTITKTGGAADEPYVFDIMKDKEKYSEVTIVGNNSETIYELPVGSYAIAEDKGWSWRYNPTYSNNGVTLSKDQTSGTITCTNNKEKDKWLNGYSDIVTNIFGERHDN